MMGVNFSAVSMMESFVSGLRSGAGRDISVSGSFSTREWAEIRNGFNGFRDSIVFLEDFNNNSPDNSRIFSEVKKDLEKLEKAYGQRTNFFRESVRLLDEFRDSEISLVTMFSAMEDQYDSFSRKVQELEKGKSVSLSSGFGRQVVRDNGLEDNIPSEVVIEMPKGRRNVRKSNSL